MGVRGIVRRSDQQPHRSTRPRDVDRISSGGQELTGHRSTVRLPHPGQPDGGPEGPPAAQHAAVEHQLTARELDVLRLVATGLDNDSIAEQLHLSTRTIERHLQNVYAKLGLHGRSARLAAARTLLVPS